jgi:putative ABC transport system permease protein
MTTILEQWRIALGALRDNAFRALLTALGIIIGVGSLVAVSAVSAGAQAGVADSIRRLGANVVVVDGEIISIGTRQTASDRVMTPADIAAVAKLPMIRAVAPHQDVEGIVVSAGSKKASTWSVGMTPTYAQIHNRGVARGRPITDADVSFGRSVALVGSFLQRRLFPGIDPIGKTLRIGNSEFEVIGVLERRGNLGGSNLDDRIFIPLPIATRVLLGGSNTRSIDVQVRGAADVNPAQDAITSLLRRQHGLPASYPNDFSTEDAASILKTGETASSTFRVLTYVLGGISLLVGGIGIMNMMLVSVRERTREIGIRMSVGADPRRVQLQFLIEALALSILGGAAGIVAGVAATVVISNTVGWQTLLDPVQSVIAFLAAMGVGVFFGFYPARKAARLDPISALRYE